jgi:hypothetical protein
MPAVHRKFRGSLRALLLVASVSLTACTNDPAFNQSLDTAVSTAAATGAFKLCPDGTRVRKNVTCPAPTPPPPPPPATKTCPDGSVIPATQRLPGTLPPPPPATQTCPAASVIPASSICHGTATAASSAAADLDVTCCRRQGAKAVQACPAINRPESLLLGAIYDVQWFGTDPRVGRFVILTINDGKHWGDGYFSFYVPVACVVGQ